MVNIMLIIFTLLEVSSSFFWEHGSSQHYVSNPYGKPMVPAWKAHHTEAISNGIPVVKVICPPAIKL